MVSGMRITALLSFIALASTLQLLIIFHFHTLGLADLYTLILVPFGVIIVLISSWMYLTGRISVSKTAQSKRGVIPSSSSFLRKLIPKAVSTRPALKSAIIILASFLTIFLLFQSQLVAGRVRGFFAPETELLGLFVLSENFSTVFSALLALVLGRRA